MKLKKKNLAIITIILGLSSVGVFYYTTKDHDKPTNQNTKYSDSKYSSKSIKQLEKLGIKNKVNTNKYSKTLDTAIFSDEFNKNYISYYEGITYYENSRLIEYINTLAKNGTAINEIDEIFKDLGMPFTFLCNLDLEDD